LESSAHHLIGPFQLPWIVIGPAMALAVVATYFAASRPARSITRIPVVPPPAPGNHRPPRRRSPVGAPRSAEAGAPLGAARRRPLRRRGGLAVLLRQSANGGGAPELVLGIVLL